MGNREKPNLAHTVIETAIPVIVGMLFTVAVQWITMENVVVNASVSTELGGQYLTAVNVQDLREKAFPSLSLYIDSEIDILDMRSSDGFNLYQRYVESDNTSPRPNYTLIIWTEQSILKDQTIAESDYKISMHLSESSIPFIVQVLLAIDVAGIVMIIGSSFTLWFSKRQIIQVQNHIQEVEEKSKKVPAETEKLSDKISVQGE